MVGRKTLRGMSSWLERQAFRLRTLLRRQVLERHLDEELKFHLEMQTEKNIRQGMSPEAARRAAKKAFGSVEQHKDACRDRWGSRLFETFWQDVTYGTQNLLSRPRITAAILLSLGLGLGVTTAVFSVVKAVLWPPLPYHEVEQLVLLEAAMPDANVDTALLAPPEVRDLRSQVASFADVAEFHFMFFIKSGDEDTTDPEPLRLSAGVVSANYFDVLGVEPLLGEVFAPEASHLDSPASEVVLSHRFWQQHFGANEAVIGQSLQLNEVQRTVVGVLPPMPDFPERVDVFLPTPACPLRQSRQADQGRDLRILSAVARLAPGHDIAEARRQLERAAQVMKTQYPGVYSQAPGFSISVTAVRDELTRDFRPTLRILVAAAGFLLLALCCSAAALLVARSMQRQHEMALCTALGAWRGRLFRQFATEHALLATAGLAIGLLVAQQCLPPLRTLAERLRPATHTIGLDLSTLAFSLALATATAVVLLGITLLASHPHPARVLQGDTLRTTGNRRPAFTVLIVVQIALSSALLIAAGLTLRSLANLERLESQLASQEVLTARLSLDFLEYPTVPGLARAYRRLLEEMPQVPGVEALAAAGTPPLSQSGIAGDQPLWIEGQQQDLPPRVATRSVSPRYFSAVGIELVAGRAFSLGDDFDAHGVAVVSASLARRHFGDEAAALGHFVRFDTRDRWLEIVGVVADVRRQLATLPIGEVYRPLLQDPPVEAQLVVRRHLDSPRADPGTLIRDLRRALLEHDPRQSVGPFESLDTTWQESLVPPRITAGLLTLFALLALLVSAIGTGGVVALSVEQRTREFGLLMALGARRYEVWFLVLRQGISLAAAGLFLGVGSALLLAPSMSSLLFEVAHDDPLTIGIVIATLLVVGIGACLVPARRAARVDPMVALRHG